MNVFMSAAFLKNKKRKALQKKKAQAGKGYRNLKNSNNLNLKHKAPQNNNRTSDK
jgi:hypothetical protein